MFRRRQEQDVKSCFLAADAALRLPHTYVHDTN